MYTDFFERLIGNFYGDPIKCELEYRKAYKYLDRYLFQRENHYNSFYRNKNVCLDKTIWICWLQGIENAPEIVKKCVDSVKRNLPEDFELILITEENFYEYLKPLPFVVDKFHKGMISRAHFSDILRVELLYIYGGCWIDSTVYCSGKIPDYMITGDLFLFQWSVMDHSLLKISNWWIYAKNSSILLRELRNMLYNYWQTEQKAINYFLFHIMFTKVLDSNSFCKSIFNNMPYANNSTPHILVGKMSLPFRQQEWEILKSQSNVHKLTYKNKIIQGDIYNFYMALMDGRLI